MDVIYCDLREQKDYTKSSMNFLLYTIQGKEIGYSENEVKLIARQKSMPF